MPHQQKEQRPTGYDTSLTEVRDDQMDASAGNLSTDVLANILGCLGVKDIMRSRGVNNKWKEAVKMTIVPLNTDVFVVRGVDSYNATAVMTTEMPNLQRITLRGLGRGNKWSDGDDPNEERAAGTANWTSHDIEIISNFSKLRILKIDTAAPLNGRYPFLFNSFPLLQKLSIRYCPYLKWDLEMLAGLPLLKELECYNIDNECVTGNISSLRVLKDTLEKVMIHGCENIEGNFMDLADFPHLKELNLVGTAVTGDIRDVGENDFSSLEQLTLPKSILGNTEFQRISDGPDLVRAVYLLKKKIPALDIKYWYGRLSRDSPDWYGSMSRNQPPLPFTIRLVEVGSRFGYRWAYHDFDSHIPCAVNWLDPEPDRESSDYEEYIAKLEEMNTYEVQLYRGFHQPPTEEEYQRLIDALAEESDSEESESDE
jgi:hypothetical protein